MTVTLLLAGEDRWFPTVSEMKVFISNRLKHTGSDEVFWGPGHMKDKIEDTEVVRATTTKFRAKF